ncbi:MAG: tripartite tricarboxylate transporter permease, partial [Candidatus Micrarchaeota archaeon]
MDLPGLLSGFLLGLLAGVIPGIHSNTIASIITHSNLETFFAASVIASMAAAHSVFEFIPAIFLFIPDSETVVSVLPGHRLLKQGRGAYALMLCAFSALFAAFFSLLILPIAYFLMPILYSIVEPFMFWVILAACAFLLASEREAKLVLLAFGVFVLSGILGLFALETPILKDPLLPVFSGLFASAGILLSFREGEICPKQIDEKIEVS